MSGEQLRALEAVAGWTWDPRGDDWQEGLASLRAFVEREGHARVPRGHLEGQHKLGLWTKDRRKRRAKLPAERRAILEALPGWSRDPFEDDWQEGLAHLRAYVEREGHARVPQSHVVDDDFRLGTWVSVRRGEFRRGALSEARLADLGSLPGWVWRAR